MKDAIWRACKCQHDHQTRGAKTNPGQNRDWTSCPPMANSRLDETWAEFLDAEPPPCEHSMAPGVRDPKRKCSCCSCGRSSRLSDERYLGVRPCQERRWLPPLFAKAETAPPPRAKHVLKAADGKIILTGGYTLCVENTAVTWAANIATWPMASGPMTSKRITMERWQRRSVAKWERCTARAPSIQTNLFSRATSFRRRSTWAEEAERPAREHLGRAEPAAVAATQPRLGYGGTRPGPRPDPALEWRPLCPRRQRRAALSPRH